MAKQVVQIARDALALGFLGETLDLGICALQKKIGPRLLGERKIAEPEDHAQEDDVFGRGKWAVEVSGFRYDPEHHRDQHQEQGSQTGDEKAKHRKRVNKHSIGFLASRVIEKGDEEEQHKCDGLPASGKLRGEKIKNEESPVESRKSDPDHQGVPVRRLDKEIHGIKQRHPADDPAATDKLPHGADDALAPGGRVSFRSVEMVLAHTFIIPPDKAVPVPGAVTRNA